MSYSAPTGNAVAFTFVGATSYSAPAGNAVAFSFQLGVSPSGFAGTPAFGSPQFNGAAIPAGFAGTPAFGTPFFTEPNVDLVGFAGIPVFGTFTLFESLSYLHVNGFAESPAFGALRLQEFLLPSGFADTALFGNPKLVPQIRLNAFNGTALFGTPDFAPPPIAKNWLRTRYLCHLTGAADGESDLLLPMSSFAIRLNPSTSSSFVQVVIPGVDSYADAIAARSNGSILITRIYDYLDGSSLIYEMARADFDSLRTDTGGQSGSTGTMQGYYTLTSSTARSYDLSNPTYRSWDGETVRYRCALDPRIRPGDTVTINDETIELRTIQNNVDVTLCLSEISGVMV